MSRVTLVEGMRRKVFPVERTMATAADRRSAPPSTGSPLAAMWRMMVSEASRPTTFVPVRSSG